jgi:inhibitor of cysteine peptidase
MENEKLLPPIRVHVGDTFTIPLQANPASTGFQCMLADMPECLYLADDHFVPPKSHLIGAPGTQIFTFLAVETGKGTLEFRDVRFTKPPEIAPPNPMQNRYVIVE